MRGNGVTRDYLCVFSADISLRKGMGVRELAVRAYEMKLRDGPRRGGLGARGWFRQEG